MKKIISTRGLLFVTMIILFVPGTFTGCQKDNASPNTPANEVWIQNSAFSPSTLTVTVNTTVKWTNKDGMTHTVTSNTGLFNSGNISNNGTYSYQFTTAGTYQYHCTIHSSMTAKVIVN